MKKLILVQIALLVISCTSSNDSTQQLNSVNNGKLKKIISTHLKSNISTTENYIYVNNMISQTEKIENGVVYKTEYTYLGNKVINWKNYRNGIVDKTLTFTYTGDLITKLTNSSAPNNYVNFTYNSANQVSSKKAYNNNVLISTTNYQHNFLNITSITEIQASDNHTLTKICEFDNQKNPINLIFPAEILILLEENGCKNNFIKSQQSNFRNTYTYNSDDYPTVRITWQGTNQDYKTEYFYY